MNFTSRLALGLALIAIPTLAQISPITTINYSGFNPNAPIAAGSIASGYGSFGSVTTTATSTASPLPTTLAGLSVRVNNRTAPLYFVSSGQINFVIPVATENGSQQVEVLNGSTVISRGIVNVWEVFPALAGSDNNPIPQGIIQNENFSINNQDSRAARGQIIQVYATGCGRTTPASVDGLAPASLSPAAAKTEAFIASFPAVVQFAGAHPQFPGICQVNITVPSQSFVTGQVPLIITVDGIVSNAVSVWIQ